MVRYYLALVCDLDTAKGAFTASGDLPYQEARLGGRMPESGQ